MSADILIIDDEGIRPEQRLMQMLHYRKLPPAGHLWFFWISGFRDRALMGCNCSM